MRSGSLDRLNHRRSLEKQRAVERDEDPAKDTRAGDVLPLNISLAAEGIERMLCRLSVVTIMLGALVIQSGCATVNPSADYEQVSSRVLRATGQDVLYRPDEDREVVLQRIEELLHDGLTVDEAVQLCLLNNRELQAAFFNVGMARADVVQSGLLSNPSLGLALRFPSGGGLANIDAGIAQNISDLWQIPVRKRIAERELDRAILELARDVGQLAAETKVQYYTAIAAKREHELSEENLKIAQDLLEMTIARRDAGAGNELEVNLSRSSVQEAELAVRAARLASSEALRDLATILGLGGPAKSLVLVDSLPEPPSWEFPAESYVGVAFRHRLDVQAAQQAVMAAAARLQEQWRMIFPSVEIGVALERDARKSQGGRDILADTARASIANGGLTAPEIQPRSERDKHTDLIIGPSFALEIPIFDQNQAQIARAQFEYQQAAKLSEALEVSVGQEVRNVVDRSTTAWETARFYRDQSLPLARSNLELSRESYRVGKTSFLAVLEAQRFFLDTRNRYVQALQDAATALPDLERTIGLPISSLVEEVGKHQGSVETNAQPHAGD